MDVLDDKHVQVLGRGKLLEQGREELFTRCAVTDEVAEGSPELASDVEQRRQRTRREETVTSAPGPPRVGELLLEVVQQGGLADARLTREQDEPTLPLVRLLGVLGQRRQVGLTFEQPHA